MKILPFKAKKPVPSGGEHRGVVAALTPNLTSLKDKIAAMEGTKLREGTESKALVGRNGRADRLVEIWIRKPKRNSNNPSGSENLG